MNENHVTDAQERVLRSVNAELARLLHRPPAELAAGAELSAGDELVLCGILGGKDVGKSTLINALAEAPVSVDHAEVGEGTSRPVAYAHRDVASAVRHRLRADAASAAAEIKWHDADAVRNAVLVDLPDFDSQFQEHLEIVQDLAPVLDRIIWVVTPRKIGDREWVRMLRRVVKDVSNVYVVLNKADELLADEHVPDANADGFEADVFWKTHERWMSHVLAPLEPVSRHDRRFLLAAAYPDEERLLTRVGLLWDDPDWTRYGGDEPQVRDVARRMNAELRRLRSQVLCHIAPAEVDQIKRANRRRQRDVNIQRIRSHYELDRLLADFQHLCDPDYQHRLLDQTIGPERLAALAADIAGQVSPERDLAERLLEQRLERWPLLRLAYWPFGWLARVVAPLRGLAGRGTGGAHMPVDSPVTAAADAGGSLREGIELMRSTLLSDHAALANRLEVDKELPAASALLQRVTAAAGRAPRQLEEEILHGAYTRSRASRIGTALGRGGLWLILLWFPLIQPLASGLLAIHVEGGALQRAQGLYRIVSALSAAHLLAGLAVVAAIYVAIIAGMYVRSLRSVRRAMQQCLSLADDAPLGSLVEELLVAELVEPLVGPFERRRATLRGLLARLESLSAP